MSFFFLFKRVCNFVLVRLSFCLFPFVFEKAERSNIPENTSKGKLRGRKKSRQTTLSEKNEKGIATENP